MDKSFKKKNISEYHCIRASKNEKKLTDGRKYTVILWYSTATNKDTEMEWYSDILIFWSNKNIHWIGVIFWYSDISK